MSVGQGRWGMILGWIGGATLLVGMVAISLAFANLEPVASKQSEALYEIAPVPTSFADRHKCMEIGWQFYAKGFKPLAGPAPQLRFAYNPELDTCIVEIVVKEDGQDVRGVFDALSNEPLASNRDSDYASRRELLFSGLKPRP